MQEQQQLDVSIVIPAYNRAESILKSIRSVGTPKATTEIVVVDDGSSDRTCEIVLDEISATTRGPTIRLYSQENQGAATARNLGLQKAKGTYVKFLDSDDLLRESALDREFDHALQTKADVVVCGWVEETPGTPKQRREVAAPELEKGVDDMLCGHSVWTAAALYRRSFIKDLRWDSAHGKADDWGWVWRVCLAGAKFSRLNILSATYILHDGHRISRHGNPHLDSTRMRQHILQEVEQSLKNSGRLTPA